MQDLAQHDKSTALNPDEIVERYRANLLRLTEALHADTEGARAALVIMLSSGGRTGYTQCWKHNRQPCYRPPACRWVGLRGPDLVVICRESRSSNTSTSANDPKRTSPIPAPRCRSNVKSGTVMRQFRAKRWGRLRWNKRCPATTWAVAPPADSRAHLFGASSWASWCRLPQTIAEARVPTVRWPSPRRRVVQPGLSRRIGAGQTMGGAIFSRDRWNDSWQ